MCLRRTVLVASLLAAGLTLSGCESFDPESWFSTKKPLPGDRRPMFPGGVPGVPQGVPQDLVKGYQPPPDNPPEVVTAEPPKPKPAPKPRPAPAPRQAAAPRQAPPPQPHEQQAPPPQASPWPAPPQQPQAQAPSPFPDPPRR
ncbi:MAG: hypothetical protein K2Z80_15935 [Xanthobacteraceae bacterium]|nr:hypothetical protein [Xanthobacteraceae bacterium]